MSKTRRKPESNARELPRGLRVRVLRGAPCGSTWFIAREITGLEIGEAGGAAGMALFRYPCYASTKWDPTRDRLHLMDLAAHIAKLAVEEAIEKALRGR